MVGVATDMVGGGYGGAYSGGYYGGTNTLTRSPNYVYNTSQVNSGGYLGGGGGLAYYSQPTYYGSQPAYYNQSTIPNQVLSYINTNPNLASVYLSDVPYTGFEDYYGTLIFISLLISWSAILAYVFLKNKVGSQKVLVKAYAETIEKDIIKDNSVVSNLMNQINSDNSDISKVEEYARTNKILLSSDASTKLIKLSRLGRINVSEYLKGIAVGEWITLGENQISCN